MASRLHKLGTIYFRVQGLLKAASMKLENKPLWFDVYEAFPPRIPPDAMRPVSDEPPRAILYPEDEIRAKFYDHYGSVDAFDLKNEHFQSESQRVVEMFDKVKEQMPGRTDDELFNVSMEKMGRGGKESTFGKSKKEEVKSDETIEIKKSGIDTSKLW